MNAIRIISLLLLIAFWGSCNSGNGNSSNEETQNTEEQASDQKNGNSGGNPENGKSADPQTDTGETSMNASGNNSREKTQEEVPKEEKAYDSIQIDIEGYIKDGENLEVILDRLVIAGREPLASTVVGNTDEFGFVGKVAGPGLFQIRFPSGVIPIVLTGGNLEVSTDINDLSDVEFEGEGGAEATRDFNRMRKIRREIARMDDSLKQVLEETEGKKRIEIHKKLNKIHRKQDTLEQKALKDFVQEMREKESIVAVIAALRMDIKMDPEFIRSVAEQYEKIYPNNYFVDNLVDKMERYDKLIEQREKEKAGNSSNPENQSSPEQSK